MVNVFSLMIFITMNSAVKAEFLPIPQLLADMEQAFRNISGVTRTSCFMECANNKLCRDIALSKLSGHLYVCHLLKVKANQTDAGCGDNKQKKTSTETDQIKEEKPTKISIVVPNQSKEVKSTQPPTTTKAGGRISLRPLSEKVCFGSKEYGEFIIYRSGKITGFLLKRLNGFIIYQNHVSYWGTNGQKGKLGTLITNELNEAIYPHNYIRTSTKWYSIKKIGPKDPELPLHYPKYPITVKYGDRFRIWFAQDWFKKSYSGDNRGKVCAKVYAFIG